MDAKGMHGARIQNVEFFENNSDNVRDAWRFAHCGCWLSVTPQASRSGNAAKAMQNHL